MKAFIDMIKSISSIALTVVITLSTLHSCSSKEQKSEPKGYLNSKAYKEYLKPDKVSSQEEKNEKINADYSIKRMFALLGEEGFLYNPEYDVYAIYMYMHKGGRDTIDYYIIKSKDSISSLAYKRLNAADHFLYVNKVNGDTMDRKTFDIIAKTKVANIDYLNSASKIFNGAIQSLAPEPKYFPEYGGPIRGLYLYYNHEYYLVTEFNLEAKEMDVIDSLFRRSLFVK